MNLPALNDWEAELANRGKRPRCQGCGSSACSWVTCVEIVEAGQSYPRWLAKCYPAAKGGGWCWWAGCERCAQSYKKQAIVKNLEKESDFKILTGPQEDDGAR